MQSGPLHVTKCKKLWLFSDSFAARNSNITGLVMLFTILLTQKSGQFLVSLSGFVLALVH
jgi:hypothetical protein